MIQIYLSLNKYLIIFFAFEVKIITVRHKLNHNKNCKRINKLEIFFC